MIRRRALLAGGATLAAPAAAAQKYPMGSKHLDLRFAGADGVMLSGTLLLPLLSELQRVPGVVLVAGSGPTDRDGNNRYLAEKIDLLKQIAELLARNGIASLRYDKRGIGQSTPRPHGGLEEQARFVAWDNFVGDVVAAQAELVRHDEVKPYATAVLGHSEGGLLALAAAPLIKKNRLHSLVLASTPGRPMADILRAQIARNAPQLLDATVQIMAAIQASGHVPTNLPRELEAVFPAYAGPFLQRLMAFDSARALLELNQACLLLQGGADRQVVPMEDVQPLIDALGKRTVSGEAMVFPAVSHNLKQVTWPTDLGFGGPIAPLVAAKLVDWLAPTLGA